MYHCYVFSLAVARWGSGGINSFLLRREVGIFHAPFWPGDIKRCGVVATSPCLVSRRGAPSWANFFTLKSPCRAVMCGLDMYGEK
jgi:hypothetical protein